MDPGKGAPSQLRFRKSVTSLGPDDVAALQAGVTKMVAVSDDRGYEHWAGIHGLPLPMWCHHGDLFFLPWHRAYLYQMEQFLLDQEPAASLPWWDWTDQAGIPAVYGDTTLADGTANPLATAPITGIPDAQFTQDGIPKSTVTFRRPKAPLGLPSAQLVEQILGLSDFADFSNQLEGQVHNRVHVWVQGTMGMVPLAAYDPVFWAHHTMIDRLWALWQLRHPGAGPDPSMLSAALPPFSMTVGQTLDITALGYQYAASVSGTAPN
ncbi:MAG: tyrosinase family protein [Actinomycetota bacterium]|nr:tyrosinase family protein [Actinomycetota bacterium]